MKLRERIRNAHLRRELNHAAENRRQAKPGPRECGTCSLCCKLVKIADVARGVWCPHCTKPGCGIYPTRPLDCSGFECMWLRGQLPDYLAPRGARVVAWESRDSKIIFLAEDGPGLAWKRFQPAIAHWTNQCGASVVIIPREGLHVVIGMNKEVVDRLGKASLDDLLSSEGSNEEGKENQITIPAAGSGL